MSQRGSEGKESVFEIKNGEERMKKENSGKE